MSSRTFASVASWEYRDMAAPEPPAFDPLVAPELMPDALTEESVADRIESALAEARRHWDARERERDHERDVRLGNTLAAFTAERAAYFKRVEAEVVQLSLAIARKVLHREASLDPTLLSGLVRIALDRLGAETPVRVRVAPDAVANWQGSVASALPVDAYEIIADASLATGDCIVETSLGTANFGIDAQLKEVERSFADLLARRPERQ